MREGNSSLTPRDAGARVAQHTPGPWMVDGPKAMDIRCRVHRVINSDRFPAAFVPAWDQPGPGEVDGTSEARGNARLIAAAPDMLSALRAIRSRAAETAQTNATREIVRWCDAAIAKATQPAASRGEATPNSTAELGA